MRSKPVLLLFPVILMMMLAFNCDTGKSISVGYLVKSARLSGEDSAAVKFLQSSPNIKARLIFSEDPEQLSNVDVVWLHIPDSVTYQAWQPASENLKFLAEHFDKGGKILLTDFAGLLPHALGLESQQPEIRTLKIKDNWLFDKKGFQSFRGHPVFSGLFGSAFVWDAFQDHRLPTIGFFDNVYPESGKVVATEKSYITIHGANKLVIEYTRKGARLLTAGGFIYFNRKNRLQYRLETFIRNSFQYLAGRLHEPATTYWEPYENRPRQFNIDTQPVEGSDHRPFEIPDSSGLLLTRTSPSNQYFDVSGRRALIMGRENGGIEEFWVHPFRVLRDYQAGMVIADSVAWLKNMPVRIEVRPESFTRFYNTPLGEIRETILPSLSKAGGLIRYRVKGDQPVQLVIKFRSDLRWMWPYDEKAIGDVWYGYDSTLRALHLKDSAGDLYAVIGGDIKPSRYLTGRYENIQWDAGKFTGSKTDLNQIYHAYEYHLRSENNFILNFAVAGSNRGQQEALQHYGALLSHFRTEYGRAAGHYKELLEHSLIVESPDPEFNKLWKWAIVGTDRFRVYTPPLGTALVAGYATTARGWNGGHKISGRPGYAWYFGRDSEWSGFAMDGYGDFQSVKQQLEFLQKFQDLSGKIFHELSTSGVVHYDAADATPLYVILAAHYLRASGDQQFIRQSWPHIRKAMDFLYSTDSDGDLLIENTNVGHGWVEGGKLWGAHTTFYLAALWAQTLNDAAYMARHLGYADLAKKYLKDREQIRISLNTGFWNDSTRFYNYGLMPDGSYNPEETVLPAVGMYYQLLDDKKVTNMQDAYASNGFSPDWGVRILSSQSPLFNPHGYHYGSVWPLFTGWTALGEYAYGNSVQGFTHILNNMYIKNHWALGYVEEVMNGATYQPSGVCPHQCWSETNILHPGIFGLVGWQPDAPDNSATLTPRFPLNWNKVRVRNLRTGDAYLQLDMERSVHSTAYRFELIEGPAISIDFAPELPAGMRITSADLDGEALQPGSETFRGLLKDTISFKLTGSRRLTFYHEKGAGMIPVAPRPQPGDVSQGFRIIRTKLDGDMFRVDLEGKSGSEGLFKMMIFDQRIAHSRGATVMSKGEKGVIPFKVSFPASENDFVRQSVSFELE